MIVNSSENEIVPSPTLAKSAARSTGIAFDASKNCLCGALRKDYKTNYKFHLQN